MSASFDNLSHSSRLTSHSEGFAAVTRNFTAGPPHHLSHRVLMVMIGDLVCCLAGLMVAMHLSGEPFTFARTIGAHYKALACWLALVAICLYYFDGYSVARMSQRLNMMLSAIKTGIVGSILFSSAIFLLSSDQISRRSWLVTIGASVLLLVLWRLAFSSVVRSYVPRRRVAIVGMGWAGSTIEAVLASRPDEFEVVAAFDDDQKKLRQMAQRGITTGVVPEAPERLLQQPPDFCVMAITNAMGAEVHRTMQRIYRMGIPITPMAELYEFLEGRVPLDHLGKNWYVNMGYSSQDPVLMLTKRAVDIVFSAVTIVLTLPLWLLVGAAVRLTSPGPVFYRQDRVGLNGRIFSIWKFRSMRSDAERNCGAVWAKQADPRITSVGRFIRRTRLDELPQFINILKGEMSLVGPRPERPEFVTKFETDIPLYGMRLAMRPGLTGWAQVRHKYDETLEDVGKKLQFDLFYIKHWSLFLDLRILVKTIATVLTGNGAH